MTRDLNGTMACHRYAADHLRPIILVEISLVGSIAMVGKVEPYSTLPITQTVCLAVFSHYAVFFVISTHRHFQSHHGSIP